MTNLKRKYFISGIDTDAGKSYATGYLAKLWQEQGYKVITHKLIQTGCPYGDLSEDIILHRKIMNQPLLPEDLDHTTCPLRFTYPCSPDVAAKIDSRSIDLSLATDSIDELSNRYDIVLIEGAGGLMVPIIDYYTMIDFAAEHSLPVILVTNPKLGSINHTLLSLSACKAKGVIVDYLIYNNYGGTTELITEETSLFLQKYINDFLPNCKFIEIPEIIIE